MNEILGKSVLMDVLQIHTVNGVSVNATLDIPKLGDSAISGKSQK